MKARAKIWRTMRFACVVNEDADVVNVEEDVVNVEEDVRQMHKYYDCI